MGKKYELTAEATIMRGHVLYRIKALRSFNGVKAGDLGGWVESEANLSQSGNAWVNDNAMVYGDAVICKNAQVCDNAQVFEDAEVCDDAKVYGKALVYDEAKIYGSAEVFGSAQVYERAEIYDDAKVYDNAMVHDSAQVFGNAHVYGNASILGVAMIFDNAKVCNTAIICDSAKVYGNSLVAENVLIIENSCIYKKANPDEQTVQKAANNQSGNPEPSSREEILAAAKVCVCGHRLTDYGKPENSFGTIAELWTTYLHGSRPEAPAITAKDVAMMLALLKVGRISSGAGSQDCFVDLAGYAACAGAIAASTKGEQTNACPPHNAEQDGPAQNGSPSPLLRGECA